VVSDLHIFSHASLYKRYSTYLLQTVGKYKIVILNGDTFDFKRSIFRTTEETALKAITWIRQICNSNPTTTFYYLIGNHDCQIQFTTRLKALPLELTNLRVADHTLRLGTKLFIHGDVIDLPDGSYDLALSRERYANAEPNLNSIIIAQIVTRMRLNILGNIRHSKLNQALRILDYLKAQDFKYSDSIDEIFFGHTHTAFRNFSYNGINFHNTGSLIRGLTWMPMEFNALDID
jgi:UDP-2,3-diacylglucosamine pyrophosphatase LpxH